MKLILIRHAQSVRNAIFKGGHFYKNDQEKLGLTNQAIPISEKGEGQAKEVAQQLYYNFDLPEVILHSGFTRTLRTARIIRDEMIVASALNDHTFSVELEQNHLLRERDAGYGFEMHEGEAAKNFPFLQEYWDFEGKWFATPPGGESIVKTMDRVSLFLHTLSVNEKYRDRTVYAVTHGGTMRTFQMVIEKIPFERADELVREAKNCEIHAYQFKKGAWGKAE
jgi:2,3-bisphosphoglycerate-dependent phosphoglycerate mutase